MRSEEIVRSIPLGEIDRILGDADVILVVRQGGAKMSVLDDEVAERRKQGTTVFLELEMRPVKIFRHGGKDIQLLDLGLFGLEVDVRDKDIDQPAVDFDPTKKNEISLGRPATI
jgi:hypothetical protein